MGLIAVNTAGLTELAAKLRAVGAAATERFDESLEKAGEIVVTDARARASYSSKIPGSIHVEVAGPGFVRVTTSLPEAVAIENRGRGHVRHPLFGTREHWYTKNSHPAFLHPALYATREEVVASLIETIHEAFVEAGLG